MKTEYVYAGLSILFWSTIAVTSKLLLGNLSSMQVLTVSSFIAFLSLFILNLVKGSLKELKKYNFKDYIKLFFTGTLGIFLYYLFLYIGIDSMNVSQAFIINYLWPIMTVLFACIVLKEKMTFKKAIAILMSFIGVIIVTSDGNLLNMDTQTVKGAIFCVLASMSYGLFSVLIKKSNYDRQVAMMIYFLSSFIICLLYIIITKDYFTLSPFQLLGMVWSGVFTSAVPNTLWALALDKGDTAKISNLAYITPFLSLVWTFLILKENITVSAVSGLLVIILGIFIQLKKTKSE